MNCLYISDLDGTLLDRNQRLSNRTREVLNRLMDQGLAFTVSTARSPVSALPILKELDLQLPLILMNGVMIYQPQDSRLLDLRALTEATARAAIEVFESHGRAPYVYTYDDGLHLQYKKIHRAESEAFFHMRREGYRSIGSCSAFSFDRPVIYINLSEEEQIIRPIFEQVKELAGVNCAFYPDNYENLWFLEVFSGQADKGSSAKRLQKILSAEKMVAFGDNYNDLPMLRTADIGIAVAGAPAEVCSAANFTIGHNHKDAVAAALECLSSVYGF